MIRHRAGCAIVALLCAIAFGGDAVGAAPRRYLDEIFTAQLTSDVKYGTATGIDGKPVDLLTDVYKPAGDKGTRRPLIVWVHSGGFNRGDKTQSTNTRFADVYARMGYVTLAINFRMFAPESCLDAPIPGEVCDHPGTIALHDAQNAIRWARVNARSLGIDPTRIAIGGYSSGAITAIDVATRSQSLTRTGGTVSTDVGAAISISGTSRTNEYVSRGDAPVAFVHGNGDERVPFKWALATAAVFTARGVDARFTVLDGIAHDTASIAFRPILAAATPFLYEKLKLSATTR